MAVTDGLRFGTDLVFTYGPLGFLSVPTPPVGLTSVLALIATGLVYLALIVLMVRGLAQFLPLWGAALVALVAARTFANLPPFEALQVVVFVLAANILLGVARPSTAAILVGGGVLTSVAFVGKLNVGVFVVAMVAVVVLSVIRPWPRAVLLYLVAVSASILGLWLLSGQSLADVPRYVAASSRDRVRVLAGDGHRPGASAIPLDLLRLRRRRGHLSVVRDPGYIRHGPGASVPGPCSAGDPPLSPCGRPLSCGPTRCTCSRPPAWR